VGAQIQLLSAYSNKLLAARSSSVVDGNRTRNLPVARLMPYPQASNQAIRYTTCLYTFGHLLLESNKLTIDTKQTIKRSYY